MGNQTILFPSPLMQLFTVPKVEKISPDLIKILLDYYDKVLSQQRAYSLSDMQNVSKTQGGCNHHRRAGGASFLRKNLHALAWEYIN